MAKGDGLPTVRDVPKTAKKSGAMRFFWIAALVIIGVGLAFLLISRRQSSGADGETVLSEENIYGPGAANDGTTVNGGSAGGVGAPPRPGPKPQFLGPPVHKPPAPGGHKPPPTKIGHGHPIHRKRSGGSGSANPPSSTTYSEPGHIPPRNDTSIPVLSGLGGAINWLFGGPNPRVPLF